MCPEVRIHKLSTQCKTGSITFRETVASDIGQELSWIDSRDGLASILHLHVFDKFDLWSCTLHIRSAIGPLLMIFMEIREKQVIRASGFRSLNVIDFYEAYGEKWLTGIRRP
jgi:hypothetical protein